MTRTRLGGIEFVAVSVPMLLGILVRIAPVAGSDFPVGDGGMFYVMVREIQRAGMTIPASTAYNHAGVPFAYPPLGLWVAALLGTILPVPLLAIFQWWPVVCSVVMLPVFYVLARRILGSWFEAVLALGAFALLPRSFEWLITGGAVTRAPGYVLGLLAMWAAVAAVDTGRRSYVALAALAAGLAIMTHPNAALVTVVSLIVVGTLRRRSRHALMVLVAVGIGAAVVSSPWWLVVLVRFGAAPLRSAIGTDGQLGLISGAYQLLRFNFAEEPFMPWITGMAALGLAWSLARREALLPVWLVGIVLLDANAAPTDATVPLAMLAAVGLGRVVLPALAGSVEHVRDRPGEALLSSRAVRLTVTALLGLAFLGAIARPIQEDSPDHAVPSDVRTAMTWVATNTPPRAAFVVVTGRDWFSDAVSEWFPAIADRVSVATVQGHEWLGSAGWWRQQRLDADLQACSTATTACLTAWMRHYGIAADYVFLPKGRVDGPLSPSDCCTALRQTLPTTAGATVVYNSAGATIVRVSGP